MLKKIILALIILPTVLVLSLINLLVIIISDIYEHLSHIPMTILGIFIVIALVTKMWLAAALFTGVLFAGCLILIFARKISILLELSKDLLMELLLA